VIEQSSSCLVECKINIQLLLINLQYKVRQLAAFVNLIPQHSISFFKLIFVCALRVLLYLVYLFMHRPTLCQIIKVVITFVVK